MRRHDEYSAENALRVAVNQPWTNDSDQFHSGWDESEMIGVCLPARQPTFTHDHDHQQLWLTAAARQPARQPRQKDGISLPLTGNQPMTYMPSRSAAGIDKTSPQCTLLLQLSVKKRAHATTSERARFVSPSHSVWPLADKHATSWLTSLSIIRIVTITTSSSTDDHTVNAKTDLRCKPENALRVAVNLTHTRLCRHRKKTREKMHTHIQLCVRPVSSYNEEWLVTCKTVIIITFCFNWISK